MTEYSKTDVKELFILGSGIDYFSFLNDSLRQTVASLISLTSGYWPLLQFEFYDFHFLDEFHELCFI